MVFDAFLLFFSTLLTSAILVFICRYLAIKFGLFLDLPNHRSSHVRAIPRCGGVPIIIVFFFVLLGFLGAGSHKIIGYYAGGLFIALVGLLDDLFGLKGKQKIIGMVLSSLIPIFFGLKLEHLTFFTNNPILLTILTLIWIYGMINAFNFMDGIDGLVSGLSLIFAVFIAVFAFLTSNIFVFFAAITLAAACMGFLFFNFNPSSIFLGDIGSMFLGYNMAMLSIMLVNQSKNIIPIYSLVLIFVPIVYDSMFTFIKRALQKKNVIEAHREHFYQRMVVSGLSHGKVSLIYYFLALVFGLQGYLFALYGVIVKITIFISSIAILIIFSVTVKQIELSFQGKKDE